MLVYVIIICQAFSGSEVGQGVNVTILESQLGVHQLSSVVTLTHGVRDRSHRLRAQYHNTAPTSDTHCNKVQATHNSDQPSVICEFP